MGEFVWRGLGSTASTPVVPVFLVRHAPLFSGWREALRAIGKSERTSSHASHLERNGKALLKPRLFPLPAFSASVAVHLLALLLLLDFPFGRLFASQQQLAEQNTAKYELRMVDLSAYLPALKVKGPGGKPGSGSKPDRPPAKGSTAFHPRDTIISNPPRPDNFKQTIIQPASPPDLKIAFDVKLPNILVGNPTAPPKPKPRFSPTLAKAARKRPLRGPQYVAAPQVRHSDFPDKLPELSVASPRLPVAPPEPAAPVASVSASGADSGGVVEGGAPSDLASGGLLALSVDPGKLTDIITLPPGNRYGAFSISPAGGQPGSPGGVPGGDPQGGNGNGTNGGAGDGSSGVGTGNHGGGGGASGLPEGTGITVSGNGTHSAGASSGEFSGGVRPGQVFPVIQVTQIRKIPFVVSTGPIGGGGLRIYGVLRGGKIATIYLPMPGKNWVLQYCEKAESGAKDEAAARNVTARPASGLLPPDALERFDFHRPEVPPRKLEEMIVLHGVIREDGTVAELKVFQGVQPDADEAARAAFGKWKFKPAAREGKPVAIEFLVGIPARAAPK